MNIRPQRFPRRAEHIAMVVQSLSGGGVQMRMLALAREFSRAGRRVDLYLATPSGRLDQPLPASVRVRTLGRNRSRALARALRRDPPDVLFAGGTSVHRITVSAAKAVPNVPLVLRASVHPRRQIPRGTWVQRLRERAKRRLRDRRYRRANLVIAVSEDTANEVRKIAPKTPLVALPNPVIGEDFAAKANARIDHPWVDGEVPIVLAIGRLAPSKDYPTLLSAFALLRRTRPARLVILGQGSDAQRRKVAATAAKLGIAKDVDLIGWTSDVPAWLARADLFVLASWWEGSPASVIEAMAAGCPVVATDSPGDTRQLLRHGELGGLVPVRDPKAMAVAMARQLDQPMDSDRLRSAAERYRVGPSAAAYLNALDNWAALSVTRPVPRAAEPRRRARGRLEARRSDRDGRRQHPHARRHSNRG